MSSFPVCVRFQSGVVYNISVKPSYTVGRFIQLIQEVTGANMSLLQLVIEYDILNEMMITLHQLGIKRGTVFTVIADQKVKATRRLMKNGIKPTGKYLRSMAGHNKIEEMKDLVKAGVPLDDQSATSHNTALIIAASMGHWKITRVLITKGADLEVCDKMGCTALWHAAVHLRLKTLNLLIDYDGEVNTGNNEGVPPLTIVAGLKHQKTLPVVELLVRHGAIIYNPALINAIEADNVDVVRILLSESSGLDIETAIALVDYQSPNAEEMISLLELKLPTVMAMGETLKTTSVSTNAAYYESDSNTSECSSTSSSVSSCFQPASDTLPEGIQREKLVTFGDCGGEKMQSRSP